MDDAFKTRERQFEAKFAHDEALKFRILVHRNKLFAVWVADQMGDGAPPDYADSFVEFALGRTPAELIVKAGQDLHNHGVALADTKLRKAFEQSEDQAQSDVMH
ncbi:MAG: Aldolase [Rhodospirillales bacterium]|nr:Aldolase [Rhodospirillales bacterium]